MAIVGLKGKLNGKRGEGVAEGEGIEGSRVVKRSYKERITSEFDDVFKALLSSFKCQAHLA